MDKSLHVIKNVHNSERYFNVSLNFEYVKVHKELSTILDFYKIQQNKILYKKYSVRMNGSFPLITNDF